jgi:hypothetical protein
LQLNVGWVNLSGQYNAIVSQYNAIVSRYNAIVSRYNAIVSQYNAIVSQYNAIVSRYNAIASEETCVYTLAPKSREALRLTYSPTLVASGLCLLGVY